MHGVKLDSSTCKETWQAGHTWLALDTYVHGGEGGGERNGKEGIVVGIVGSEGMLGNGGKLTFGTLGMVGKLGRGGKAVGLGRDGWVVGRVGMAGKGGNVGLGIFGTGGRGGNWRRWRAAKATSMPEAAKARDKAKMKHLK
uniref:Uncharacterized protein n=1 Tax=Populus alba TaxID=43335 RepID=A0A4U5Q9W7_POPAL|nr:hypothetical protein D5086_0000117220 [Populus alba]